jgi:hypothetical protein
VSTTSVGNFDWLTLHFRACFFPCFLRASVWLYLDAKWFSIIHGTRHSIRISLG